MASAGKGVKYNHIQVLNTVLRGSHCHWKYINFLIALQTRFRHCTSFMAYYALILFFLITSDPQSHMNKTACRTYIVYITGHMTW